MNFRFNYAIFLVVCFLFSFKLVAFEFPEPTAPTPSTPSSVTVPTTSFTGNYTLSWSSVDGAAYYLWREQINGTWSVWNNITGDSANITERSDGTYKYEVKACHPLASPECGNVRTSNNITVTLVQLPGAPGPITISDGVTSTDGTYRVEWTGASNQPTRYEYKESINGVWGNQWISTGLNTSVSITGNNNGTYVYRARACNTAGCGTYRTSSNVVVTLPTAGSVSDAYWGGDTPKVNGNLNVGALEGSGGVSGGAATYSIPIIIPPGRAAMQPSISLNYSSRSGNGVAGMGWSLSAGSSIHRCAATYAQEGVVKNVSYGADDKLCLDGQKLIKTSGTYGYSGSEYRTEQDIFARVTLYGGINSSSSWFKVESKSGNISKYGSTSQSRHKVGGKSQTLTWAIEEVQDRFGNTMTYDYTPFNDGEYSVSAIHYTGLNGNDGDRHVRFYYEERPDVSTSYMAGGKSRQTQRLTKIISQYQSTKIREYRLNYGAVSLATNRTLLRDVTECAYKNGTEACLLPTKFEWLEAETQYSLEKVDFADHSKRWLDRVLPHGDYNGDGVKDWPNKFTNAEGEVKGAHSSNYSNCYVPQNSFTFACLDADFNQDGKTDKFKKINDTLHIQYQDSSSWINTNIVWSEHDFLSLSEIGTPEYKPKADYPLGFSDFNGDGLQDIAFFHTNGGSPKLMVYWNSGNRSAPFSVSNSALIHDYPIRTSLNSFCSSGKLSSIYCNVNQTFLTDVQIYGDIDGNGTSDFVVFDVQGGKYPRLPKPRSIILTQPSSSGFSTSSVTPFGEPAYLNEFNAEIVGDFFADINGDGLVDWLSLSEGSGAATNTVNLKLNIGGGEFQSSWTNLNFAMPVRGGTYETSDGEELYFYPVKSKTMFMDYDGDGKSELLVADGIVASACAKINGFSEAGAAISEWKCDEEMYSNYIQTVVGGARAPANPTQIHSDLIDDSVRSYKAIFFKEALNGTIATEEQSTNLVASGTQYSAVDAFGNGLTDVVTVFGCRWTDCKWNGNASSYGGTVQNSSLTEGVWVMRNKGAAKSDELYQPIDMMVVAENALENRNEWIYKPLSTGTYKDSDNNEFYELTHSYQENDNEYFHFASSMYAVAEHKYSDGIGGSNNSFYRYRGAMYNTQGRGFQGFKQIIVDNLSGCDIEDLMSCKLNEHIRTVSDFHQKFPLSGKLEQSRSCLAGSGGVDCQTTPISKTEYSWDLWRDGSTTPIKSNIASANGPDDDFSGFVKEGKLADDFYTVTPNTQTESKYKTSSNIDQSLVVDFSSGWIYQKISRQHFDAYACPTSSRTTYQEPGSQNINVSETKISYSNIDTSSWWLCKPASQTVTSDSVTNRDENDFASTLSGTDFEKQVTTSFEWHSIDKPSKVTVEATKGQGTAAGLQSIVRTEYNNYGLPTKVTSNGDHWTGANMVDRLVTTAYTTDGYFVNSIKNSKGHETHTVSDPIHGQAIQVVDPNDQVTTMTYDNFGRIRSTKLPGEPTQWTAYWWCSGVNGGGTWCPGYDGAKYRALTQAKGSPDTNLYYDMYNRQVRSLVKNFTNSQYYQQRDKYNNKGQKILEGIIDAGKTGWAYTYYDSYDALGRLTKKRTPQSDDSHMKTYYSYDGFRTDIRAEGETTLEMSRTYNGLDQLVNTVDAMGGVTKYAYDGAGNPITLQDANGNSIYAKYNALGHKEYVDDPNMGIKRFWYNTFGEVEKEIDAEQQILTYSYDTLGRMTQRWTNGVRSGYWYWDNGNVQNYIGQLRYEFNVSATNDRLTKYYYYKKTAGGKVYLDYNRYRTYEDGAYKDELIHHYVDSNFGRPKGMKYGSSGLTLAYEYNDRGYMAKVKNASGGYVYQEIQDLDAHGKITKQLRTNSLLTELANYHPATGQMMDVTTSTSSNPVSLHELAYQYSGFSNLYSQFVSTPNGANSEYYNYDSLHRLTRSWRQFFDGSTDIVHNYNFDAVGNFTSKSDYGSTYQYGNRQKSLGGSAGTNAVRSVLKTNGTTVSFSYDKNGNLLSGDGKALSYNEFNKPLTVQKGSVISAFSYGADLMRYKHVKSGLANGKTEITYYADKLLEKVVTKTNNNVTKTEYKHYIGDVAIHTKTLEGSNSSWKLAFTHRDRLGSVVTLTDDQGKVIEHRSYDPFGKPRKGDFSEPTKSRLLQATTEDWHGATALVTNRGFTDHEHLDDAELIHMNGRAYDYNLGRFLSVDPFIQAPGNSQSMNPYSYIMNNPLAAIDPSGYCATTDKATDCVDSIKEGETREITDENGKGVGTIGKDKSGKIHITKANGHTGKVAVQLSMQKNIESLESKPADAQFSPGIPEFRADPDDPGNDPDSQAYRLEGEVNIETGDYSRTTYGHQYTYGVAKDNDGKIIQRKSQTEWKIIREPSDSEKLAAKAEGELIRMTNVLFPQRKILGGVANAVGDAREAYENAITWARDTQQEVLYIEYRREAFEINRGTIGGEPSRPDRYTLGNAVPTGNFRWGAIKGTRRRETMLLNPEDGNPNK